MLETPNPVGSIPEPKRIRSRLTELATEANFLRALLRLLERNRCGQRMLWRTSPKEIEAIAQAISALKAGDHDRARTLLRESGLPIVFVNDLPDANGGAK